MEKGERIYKNLNEYLDRELATSKKLLDKSKKQLNMEFLILLLIIATVLSNLVVLNLIVFLFFWIVVFHGIYTIKIPLSASLRRLDGAFIVLEILGHLEDKGDGMKRGKKEKESKFLKAVEALKNMLRLKAYNK